MNSRLASFRGPSNPTTSPVKVEKNSPSSPARASESTYHRKIRTLLQELRSIAETWDDLVLIDGLKAAKSLIDARTDLDNDIALLPDGKPRTIIVGPKLRIMEKYISELDSVMMKLNKQFRRMDVTIESMETILFEASKMKGWQWVSEDPLWITWSLEKFVISVSSILVFYHRSLNLHNDIVNTLRSHSTSFEDSQKAITQWVQQPWLVDEGWDARWEDICAVEVDRWAR